METFTVASHLNSLRNRGVFEPKVLVEPYEDEESEWEEIQTAKGRGKVKKKLAKSKAYVTTQPLLVSTREYGPLELRAGDQVVLYRTSRDFPVGVAILRKALKGVYGWLIHTSCRDIKSFLPK